MCNNKYKLLINSPCYNFKLANDQKPYDIKADLTLAKHWQSQQAGTSNNC